MSTFLYGLGHRVARHRFVVLALWGFLAVIVFALSGLVGGKLVNDYTVPGTESQRGIDTLDQRFPQASGTTGQVVWTSPSGAISSQQSAIEGQLKAIKKIKHVSSVVDPFASGSVGTISTDKKNALAQIQFDVSITDLPAGTPDEVAKATKPPPGAKFTVTLGGDMYSATSSGVSLTDVIGVAVAFVVLTITFASLVSAGLPLITAILGVAVTLAGTTTIAAFTTISTTAPTLALMIGLAVGIDYGLFIVTRHRRQLTSGLEVEESVAQALATAGSAVVFAGTTVIIALCGLAVAQIPFLSVMGFAASAGVAVAVAAALTLLPAILSVFGNALRPKQKSKAARLHRAAAEGRRTMGGVWEAIVTKVPVLTVLLVLAVITVLALPVKDLALALPDNGSDELGSPQRTTYDLIAKEFGPGYNSPLLVTADVITSSDPKKTVSDLADDLKKIKGVVAITKETPNAGGDLGLVSVISQWAQSDPRTTALVGAIRARGPTLEKQLKIADFTVTGTTAVAIDVSTRLAAALVPFGVVVVGLALILLTIVFRSIAVPLKATLGYLLSIMAALGVVTAVFIWGWFDELLGATYTGPIVSFFPIILMGVLFGLAMDYEVFLVSAIREDYVHGHDARHAIRSGFTSSARVVTAAAIIMISVFTAFIPEGTSTIKPIALGLAVGVFVDAFAVRMTLVPAVLALLGDLAWWIPRRLDQALPTIDVEGAALVRHVEQVEWEEANGAVAVRAEALPLPSQAGPGTVDLRIPTGVLYPYEHPDAEARSALTWTVAGWRKPAGGELAVLGRVLPEEAGLVRKLVRVVSPPSPAEDPMSVHHYLSTVLLAQSKRPWPSPRTMRAASRHIKAWLGQDLPAGSRIRLRRQRLGALAPLDRRMVGLLAMVHQDPKLIIVEEVDAGLAPVEVERFRDLCAELVPDSGITVVLVGAHLDAPIRPRRERPDAVPGDSEAPPAPTTDDPSPSRDADRTTEGAHS